jgi:hypothetical protein
MLIYEGFFGWDVGWLVLAGDRLCYVGDRVRFELPRDQVRSVRLGKGPPGLSSRPRICLT